MDRNTGPGRVASFRPGLKKIDMTSSEAFSSSLQPFISEGVRLVLDVSEVQFIDSSGIGKILAALRSLRERGGDMRICGAQAPVAVLFGMVRLAEVVGIDADFQASKAAFEERPAGKQPES